MADYLPRFQPGASITSTTSGAVVAGNMVAVTGSGTVGVAGANADNFVGVAGHDAASGAKLTILTGGVQKLVASGTVTAGDKVACAAAGTVATISSATITATAALAAAVIGTALTTATNGQIVDVQMER